MSEWKIIRKIRLDKNRPATGNTRHYRGNHEVTNEIKELKIIKYNKYNGYYLMYYNDKGRELTDTYHDTLDRAFSQAEFEFNVKPDDWEVVNEEYK